MDTTVKKRRASFEAALLLLWDRGIQPRNAEDAEKSEAVRFVADLFNMEPSTVVFAMGSVTLWTEHRKQKIRDEGRGIASIPGAHGSVWLL